MEVTDKKLVRLWIASTLLGESVPFKIKGTKEQMIVLAEALMATRVFEQTLVNEDSTVEMVVASLERKHVAVQRFEKAFGKNHWPL